MTDLALIRTDLREFSIAVGLELTSRQAVPQRRRVCCCVAPRQSGKSRRVAVTALWQAFGEPNQRILLVSAGERASRDLLALCHRTATTSPLLGPSVVDELTGELTFSNGSVIRSVPSSEGAIRGQSIDLLAVDECALVPAELFYGAIWPVTAARPNAKVILSGTPGSPEGPFYEFVRAGEQGDEHVEVQRWHLEDATWIEPTVVDAARAALPAAVYSREFMAEFADVGADERVIPRDWIHAAQERALEPGPVAFGCDVARRGVDSSVICEMRGPVARIIYSTLGHDTMALAAKLAQISRDEKGPPPALAVDEIAVGGGVVDRLVELDVPVAGYNASHRAPDSSRFANMRASSYWHLRELFRVGEISLDRSDHQLADELGSLTYKLDAQGRIQLADKASMAKSPDRADALCICAWAQGRRALSEQTRALLEQAKQGNTAAWQRDTTEEELAGQRTTEELWGRPKRERIVDNNLPVMW